MKAIELQNKIDQGLKVKVFDTRLREKYDNCHITGAINIEKGNILENPSKYIDKDEKVYITCNGGNSASLVANILKKQGYDIEHLEEGMNPLVRECESNRGCFTIKK